MIRRRSIEFRIRVSYLFELCFGPAVSVTLGHCFFSILLGVQNLTEVERCCRCWRFRCYGSSYRLICRPDNLSTFSLVSSCDSEYPQVDFETNLIDCVSAPGDPCASNCCASKGLQAIEISVDRLSRTPCPSFIEIRLRHRRQPWLIGTGLVHPSN